LIKQKDVKRKKLEALGIEYDFPGYAASAVNTDVAILTLMKTTRVEEEVEESCS
jgi:hypothetical protein